MKTNKFFMAILGIALCVNFFSCGDDEGGGNVINPNAPAKRVIRVVETHPERGSFIVYDFDYDAEGRVISIREDQGDGYSYDITYSGENLAIAHWKYDFQDYDETWTLNERGDIVSIDDDFVLLDYNSDGYLTRHNQEGSITDYVYEDGLLLSGDKGSINITYTDIPNIGNICVEEHIYPEWGREFAYAGFIGNHYRLLPKRMVWNESSWPVVTFEYELDADGYVKSVNKKNGDSIEEILDFTYEEIR